MIIKEIETIPELCEKKVIEIKVRKGEADDGYFLFPREVVENTLNVIKKNNIYVDCISANSSTLDYLHLQNSIYNVEELDASEVLAVASDVQIEELYELIEYVNSHANVSIKVRLFKNSELPEFQKLLVDDMEQKYPEEVVEELKQYMRFILDMSDSDRWEYLIDLENKTGVVKMLNMYTPTVREFILGRLSKRFATELRSQMGE